MKSLIKFKSIKLLIALLFILFFVGCTNNSVTTIETTDTFTTAETISTTETITTAETITTTETATTEAAVTTAATSEVTTALSSTEITTVEFTVSFNSVGGSVVNDIIVVGGMSLSEPDEPVLDGYTILGWFLESEYITEFDFDEDAILEDTTLYAKWCDNADVHEIIFLGFNNEVLATYEYGYTKNLSEMVIPEVEYQDGYIHLGWDQPLISVMPNEDVTYQAVFQEIRIEEFIVGGDDQRTYVYGDYVIGIYREYEVRATLTVLKLSDEEYRRVIVIEGEDATSIRSFHIYGDKLIVDAGLYDDELYYHSMSLYIYDLEDSESEEVISDFIIGEDTYIIDRVLFSEEYYIIVTNDIAVGEGKVIIKSLSNPSYEVVKDIYYEEGIFSDYVFMFNHEYFIILNMDDSPEALTDEVIYDIYKFSDENYHRSISSDYILEEGGNSLDGNTLTLWTNDFEEDGATCIYHIYSLSDETFFFSGEEDGVYMWNRPGVYIEETDQYVVLEKYWYSWTGASYLDYIIIYDKDNLTTEIISITNIIGYVIADNQLIYLAAPGEDEGPTNLYIVNLEDTSNIITHYPPDDKDFSYEVLLVDDYIIAKYFSEGDGYSIFKLSDSDYRYDIGFDSNDVVYTIFSNLDFVTFDWSNELLYLLNLNAPGYAGTVDIDTDGLTHLLTISSNYIIFSIGDEVYIIDISQEAYPF